MSDMDHKKVIVQWQEFELPETLPRAKQIAFDPGFITTVTGPRRAGKTWLCFQAMRKLLDAGVPRSNMLYINFEDEKLRGAGAEDLESLLAAFFELSEIGKKHDIYLFLDEIQNVNDWDIWVRRTHDMRRNIRLVVTGSSSKMLSKELSTRLRGRVLNVEVMPVSFREWLGWKGISYGLKTISQSDRRFAVKKEFNRYLTTGGFPAVLTSKQPAEPILQGYFDSMIFKDVVERNRIKDSRKVKMLAGLLFESVAKEISYSRLSDRLSQLGFDLTKKTVIGYMSYFEDAYLFFQNLRYEYSLMKRLGSVKKLYCIDNGLLNSVSFKFSEDRGRLLENLVFIELKRMGMEVYYNRGNNECDFIVKEKDKVTAAIQVTEELGSENRERELAGLLEAMGKFGLASGTIITCDQEEERIIGGRKVSIIPAWKWLLV